ncbi:mechanosensitive ion channel family protein [Paenibacillus sp. CGMCC 1.16610]|uniref:Mechanosensitive ion channel n=1 Tax=Paenibacillus anseongense TaxID=2682845 RepID=A0ABW9UJI7_9BACL|nr:MULTISPECIES: mechanosensitive ion channel family protein [Paenibacillus]MBA2939782.1 mechanosensitive ion channel family protein [Paenibacillus sp. CGMCC 1.16610]MVQ39442.1 mechanosensitive ion channel [Paenibacillus anseongense]
MELIKNMIEGIGLNSEIGGYMSYGIMVLSITLLCILANFITKKVFIKIISHVTYKNNIQWNLILLERKVFHKCSHVVPAFIIYYFSYTFPSYQHLIEIGAVSYMIIMGLLVMDSLLDAVNDIYKSYEISKIKPIRGYIQVVKIVLTIVCGILVIANLIGESPLILLSGIGAISAVLMLVFKDSILGLVAGVQLTANDMVRVGDWIEMPKYGADGDVIDISLNTVKVQNFDKTITTIPSYTLISDSFKNWRGMQKSGGRRIKRSIFIDTSSICFCTNEMLERFKSIHYLTEYILDKEREIQNHNKNLQIDTSNRVNGRALTNIGVFRTYIDQYLKNHHMIHQNMTCLVRQLASGETGLPLEIYAFTNSTEWQVYEAVQSDIFDHIFAIAPEFGLRIFQNPTGYDVKSLSTVSLSNYSRGGAI